MHFLASFCYMIAGYPLCAAKRTACVFFTIIGGRVTGDARGVKGVLLDTVSVPLW